MVFAQSNIDAFIHLSGIRSPLGVCFLSWVLFEFKFFDEAKWELASLLNCTTFSYALLICGTSLLIASLNVKGKFFEGASSPLILNSVLIICLAVGIFCQITNLMHFAFLLGLAVLLAGVLQTWFPGYRFERTRIGVGS